MSAAKKIKKKREKMKLAKNKNELILACVVFALFIGKSAYDLVNNFILQNMPPKASSNISQERMPSNGREGVMPEGMQGGMPPGHAPMSEDASKNIPTTVDGTTPQPTSPQGANATNPFGSQPTQPSQATNESPEIMVKTPMRLKTGKMVMVPVVESGRTNPFLPAAENFVPKAVAKLHLPPPPKQITPNSDTAEIITTKISGIMYDRYSPSAIINIAGMDYLVRRGDIVNRYKILSITPNQVSVQLGSNIYKAGVGQILALSKVNFNPIANLSKKFGGSR